LTEKSISKRRLIAHFQGVGSLARLYFRIFIVLVENIENKKKLGRNDNVNI